METTNFVCRNYDLDKDANSILGSIHLHCDQCEHTGNCVIETAYQKAKDYSKIAFDNQIIEPNDELLKAIGMKGDSNE